ncbi:MAG: S8 family serine peptidase [Candidatus Anammoxibacter sp.]
MDKKFFNKSILTFVSFIFFVSITCILVAEINAGNSNAPDFHTKPAVITGGSETTGKPPFRSGQVVVNGSPEDFGDYDVVKYLPLSNLTILSVKPGKELGEIKRLRGKGFDANLNLTAKAFGAENEPFYSFQWHFPMIQSVEAWGITDGFGVTVAVLDTGLRLNGNDGIGCVVQGRDIVNSDSDPTDGEGHGTHVSGTIAQNSDNGVGVAGMAHGSCIMPVKVLSDSGSGSFADIAEGVRYAVDNGAKVINMSLGTNARFNVRNDAVMDSALDYAYNNGVTVVCAAGNDGFKKNVSYPAIYPTTIAVGAVDLQSKVTRYSNRGDGLDIVAPGGDNTKDLNGDGFADGVLQETFDSNGVWSYWFYSGTSMSSPHVAAVAAMLYATGIATDADSAYSALTSTAKDLGNSGYDSTSGYGLVQAFTALGGVVSCIDADSDGYCNDVDCNDNDPAVNPGAAEICGDGIDNNCDGVIDEDCPTSGCTDNDGDGWCVEDGDCDDNNAHVYPGHPDKKGKWGRDGLDNDCNGIIDG